LIWEAEQAWATQEEGGKQKLKFEAMRWKLLRERRKRRVMLGGRRETRGLEELLRRIERGVNEGAGR
jgi:hypothetical protein